MDPVTIGAVLLAIVSGAGGQLGAQLWEGVASLCVAPSAAKPQAVPTEVARSGEAELAALQEPGDRQRAVALAEALLARSGADGEFRQALESWWQQAEPVRVSIGNVANTIIGGTQRGPVLQGRDFSNITFGTSSPAPPVPPSRNRGN